MQVVALTLVMGMAGLAAACGSGDGGQGIGPRAPGTGTAPAASGSVPAKPGPSGSPNATSPAGTVSLQMARGITPTAMANELKELGLDPKALPPLSKLDPTTLRKVMKTFTRSLGVQCNGCHDTKDFKAPTAQKKIATHMWNDFARGLAFEDGAPVYCDSCHGGHKEFLERRDTRRLGDWMTQNYTGKLKRIDGNEHTCETCHGDPFEGDIFGTVWK